MTIPPALIEVDYIGDATEVPVGTSAESNYIAIGIRDAKGMGLPSKCVHEFRITKDPIVVGSAPVELYKFRQQRCFGPVKNGLLCITNRDPKPGPEDLPNLELCAPLP